MLLLVVLVSCGGQVASGSGGVHTNDHLDGGEGSTSIMGMVTTDAAPSDAGPRCAVTGNEWVCPGYPAPLVQCHDPMPCGNLKEACFWCDGTRNSPCFFCTASNQMGNVYSCDYVTGVMLPSDGGYACVQ
jgi:hypothetical protein